MAHKPKWGDRFIHARYLTEDARPPYDTDDKFEVRVVTRVTSSEIYHSPESTPTIAASVYSTYWDSGIEAWEKQAVRKWL